MSQEWEEVMANVNRKEKSMGLAKSKMLDDPQPDSVCVVEYVGERLYFGAEQVIDAIRS